MALLRQIKASAGSGKTHELTRRYLDFLVSCHMGKNKKFSACAARDLYYEPAIGDILVITFTNAAVAEMRDRALRDLKKAALGRIEIDGLGKDAARQALKSLLLNLGKMNIRTIDSLLHQITRNGALGLGLSPDFKPTFSVQEAMKPFLDKFSRDAESGDPRALELLERVAEKNMLYDDLRKKPEAPRDIIPAVPLAKRMEPYFYDALLPGASDLARLEVVEKKLKERMDAASRSAKSFLDYARKHNDSGKGAPLKLKANEQKRLERVAGKNFKEDNVFNIPASAGAMFKEKSLEKNPEIAGEVEALHAELADAASSLAAIKKPFEDYIKKAPFLELARHLAADFGNNLQNEIFLPSFLMASYARKALDTDYGICDALCRMGNRLTHFLVDEFQDTSREQWEGFRAFVDDAPARGGTFTWVGDVKQSIYGWRNAAPELFDELLRDKTLLAMEPKPDKTRLEYNYRSHENIVKFNNSLFGGLDSDKHPDCWQDYARKVVSSLGVSNRAVEEKALALIGGAYALCPQECPANAKPGGYAQVEFLGENNGEFWEAFPDRLVDALKNEIHPGRDWADIMILFRSNEEITKIAPWLIKNEIPVVTENSLMLWGHPLIEQLVAFLEFLDNPLNDIAFLAMISGSIFRDHEGRGDLPDAPALGLLNNEKYLWEYFSKNYPQYWQKYIEPFYDRASLLTPYDAMREWMRGMNVEERFPRDKLFLRSFLELAQSAEGRGIASISAFLEFWREKGMEARAHTPENINAVRIMTIHKAKGLQAPVVIVPLPEKDMRVGPGQYTTNIVREFDGELLEVGLLKDYEPEYSNLAARNVLEALNLVYVAFTRPKEELYIWSSNASPTFLRVLLEGAGIDPGLPFGEKANLTPKEDGYEDISASAELIPAGLSEEAIEPMAWLPRLKIAHSRLSEQSFTSDDRGSFLHFCLENMRFTGNAAEDGREALEFGLAHCPIAVPEDSAVRGDLLDSLAWYAGQTGVESWLKEGLPEQPVMDASGNELRVDLLVPRAWGLLVVDYKSGRQSPRHVGQVQRYMRCLEQSGATDGEIAGVLVYLRDKAFTVVTKNGVHPPVSRLPGFLGGYDNG